MKNTKIIQLLKTFTPAEFNEFGKFLNSPFHNESLKMIKQYKYLKMFYPEFNNPHLTKEIVFRKMYGDVKYDDKKIRERFSDMLKLAESYLAIINLRKNPAKYKMHTLNEFLSRDLAVHFDKKHREISAILDKVSFKNENSFYEDYLLQSTKIEFYQSANLLGKRISFFDEIGEHIELFLRYFIAQMLKNYAVINNIKTVLKYPYEHKFYKPVMDYIDENNLERYPLIKALRLMIKIHENTDDIDSYFELKALYLKYHFSMDTYDKTMIGTELLIHARIMLRAGKAEFRSEAFEMMKLQIEHGTHPLEKGYMKRETFLVSVDTAINYGKIDWARQFIRRYSAKVEPGQRGDLLLWSAGTLFFYEKKYALALKEFSKIKTGDFIFYFWVKVPVSKIYFEMKDYENVLMLIDSVRHYTSNNKRIPEYFIVWYSTYFNLLHKLTVLTLNFDEFKASKLVEEIISSKISVNAINSWLMIKARELVKKK